MFTKAMAAMMLCMLCPKIATSAMAKTKTGKACSTSEVRIRSHRTRERAARERSRNSPRRRRGRCRPPRRPGCRAGRWSGRCAERRSPGSGCPCRSRRCPSGVPNRAARDSRRDWRCPAKGGDPGREASRAGRPRRRSGSPARTPDAARSRPGSSRSCPAFGQDASAPGRRSRRASSWRSRSPRWSGHLPSPTPGPSTSRPSLGRGKLRSRSFAIEVLKADVVRRVVGPALQVRFARHGVVGIGDEGPRRLVHDDFLRLVVDLTALIVSAVCSPCSIRASTFSFL